MPVKVIQDEKVITLQEMKLVGYRVWCAGEEYAEEIPKTSRLIGNRLKEIKKVRNKDEDGYWVAIEVEEFEDIPKDMVTLTIPAQKYARAIYRGSNKRIFDAYDQLHKWESEQGYQRSTDKWNVEIFQSWQNPDQLIVELFDAIQ
ncbi:transcription activator [[Bacillus] enclensis]|uniref:GyrI-like small molecule binding domain-containing protein n=1 Tax=[Bacillus] enclensis TaxID=1402860 RepID=A0A0V8HPW8_9BACI|nr:GyrI-like domain-containing protein [[Bacillus] enclensis]KSU64506.1 transcription activator [[Bacillus] enclensis]SCB75211.1 GyrI-like small molecule binding domain-containing protein [[Bacillus] enclensis]